MSKFQIKISNLYVTGTGTGKTVSGMLFFIESFNLCVKKKSVLVSCLCTTHICKHLYLN